MTLSLRQMINLISLIVIILLCNGCDSALLYPKGQIAIEQRSLILTAFGLMMIVVLPAIFMAVYFTYRYRESNINATYNPHWDHSNKIEAVVWTIPILIISFLGILTWKSTHTLEPRNPLKSLMRPIQIEVVSLDWKWLFIYPEQGIATINKIVFPAHYPIHFKITSHTVMNSFFIPTLGSQMYAMAGMQTQLNLIANEAGTFHGISANYSGHGFSHMKFQAIATHDMKEFTNWITEAKKSSNTLLTMDDFYHLTALKNSYSQVLFSRVKPRLFNDIMNQFKMKHHNVNLNVSHNTNDLSLDLKKTTSSER
ncbi:Cytochrome bo(3) ubiquinol oxidase subunit 2 [Candidatus Erwinia haradaeae]|uniref:Ubiquinol oxidase subunit 2 n=1 Tax=Candidatus Erwinia haradaeae TaxID=1922217 RepID=A0A451DDC2_9GAMM|nr:ubiquinol oxidase subunit II [Candidatus Erwinia haradaeae]VFP84470.1 Cytochrome bo(3) ubiquinol oxidase subunit 2 [Candidatus Erwinia haradaeae]